MGLPLPAMKTTYKLDPLGLLQKYAPLRMIFRFNPEKVCFEGLTQLPGGQWSWDHEHVFVFASVLHMQEPESVMGMDGSMLFLPKPPVSYPGDSEAEYIAKTTGDPSAFLLDPLDADAMLKANLWIGWIDWFEGRQAFELCNAKFKLNE